MRTYFYILGIASMVLGLFSIISKPEDLNFGINIIQIGLLAGILGNTQNE